VTGRALSIKVHLHGSWYHGRPEWPPSPARLYQALVAGSGPCLSEEVAEALSWIEQLPAPVIAVPRHKLGQSVPLFVPNNDLDSKGGDPERVGSIRAAKTVHPRLLDGEELLYLWAGCEEVPEALPTVTERLYQLGRGVDPAWAECRLVDSNEAEAELRQWNGEVYRPTPGGRAGRLRCPSRGTLRSLERRYKAQSQRFRVEREGRKVFQVFSQPPRAVFSEVSYGEGPMVLVLELRSAPGAPRFEPWALADARALVVAVRDAAVDRLRRSSLPNPRGEIEAVLVGRRPGVARVVDSRYRVRIIPVPSIGHQHTDPAIRRVAVQIPRGGPVRSEDLRWAFTGLEVGDRVLVGTDDDSMLRRYTQRATLWRSITPLALRGAPRRGREAPTAPDRLEDEARARQAVRQALRHAGVASRVRSVWVQREPLHPGGEGAAAFASGRFRARDLWHVEIRFEEPLHGPLVLGDGRYMGLGLMIPIGERAALRTWTITGGLGRRPDPMAIASGLRRAVMARYPDRCLPWWISGHRRGGDPVQGHSHLFFGADLERDRVFLIDPAAGSRGRNGHRLDRALEGFSELRCGASGLLRLRPVQVGEDDPLVASHTAWESVTPYRVRRHRKLGSAAAAVELDLREALHARGFPEPTEVEVLSVQSERGLSAKVRIRFAVAVSGPMMLGRSAHKGGGLFEGV